MDRDDLDFFAVAIIILIALLFLSSMGCRRPIPVPRDHVEIKLYPQRGKCWLWDTIETEIAGHTLCSERRVINGYNTVCTRRLGHNRAHHMHGAEDCRWIW